jgi:predicted transcriptional regulator
LGEILLSIKPEFVNKILEGTKKFEFRKRPAKSDVDLIYIYSTYPVMKIMGTVEVESLIHAAPSTLWEQTKAEAGISRKRYREYFKGCKVAYAYKLGKVSVFDIPKDLIDYNISLAPQSFIYINLD